MNYLMPAFLYYLISEYGSLFPYFCSEGSLLTLKIIIKAILCNSTNSSMMILYMCLLAIIISIPLEIIEREILMDCWHNVKSINIPSPKNCPIRQNFTWFHACCKLLCMCMTEQLFSMALHLGILGHKFACSFHTSYTVSLHNVLNIMCSLVV